MYIIINTQTNLKAEGQDLDKVLETFKKAEKLKKYDLNNDGKIDEKDFTKAGKVLNKAKNNN
jgi:Ca2+-binding EF-hand superfamily protein